MSLPGFAVEEPMMTEYYKPDMDRIDALQSITDGLREHIYYEMNPAVYGLPCRLLKELKRDLKKLEKGGRN